MRCIYFLFRTVRTNRTSAEATVCKHRVLVIFFIDNMIHDIYIYLVYSTNNVKVFRQMFLVSFQDHG